MCFNIQPTLHHPLVTVSPLDPADFEALYTVASDPDIWQQHPNKDRWKREVFTTFFKGALESLGAFKVIDNTTGELAGCTRFYDYNEQEKSVSIGYTFYATKYWGTGTNHQVKRLMMDYAFQYVDVVYFHIGAVNTRSQVSITRLGAEKIGEQEIAYYGEAPKLNYIYQIKKEQWVDSSRATVHHSGAIP